MVEENNMIVARAVAGAALAGPMNGDRCRLANLNTPQTDFTQLT